MGDLLGLGIAAQGDAAAHEDRLVLLGDGFGDRGAHGARADGVDGDPLGPEIHRQRARQPDHTMLGGRIGRVPRRGAQPVGRGDVDDPRAVRAPQQRQRRPDQPLVGRQHHLQRARPHALVVLRIQRRGFEVARVVDEEVEGAEARLHRRHRLAPGGCVGDVEGQRQDLSDGGVSGAGGVDLRGHGLRGLGVQVGRDHMGALGREDPGGGAAHAGARAGDEDDAAGDGAGEGGGHGGSDAASGGGGAGSDRPRPARARGCCEDDLPGRAPVTGASAGAA